MSTRFLVIARVVDDGFDDANDYYLDFEVTVKPLAMADPSVVINDWYYTAQVPENLVEVEGPREKNDLYKYLQEEILEGLYEEFGQATFSSVLDVTDVLLQGVAGKGERGDSNGPEWQNQWRRGFAYKKNDVVVWESRAFICIQDMVEFKTYEGWAGVVPDVWPDNWTALFNNPPVLTYIDPDLHVLFAREVGEALNPNRYWDQYTAGPVEFKGNWQANTTYRESNVVVRAKIRRKKKNRQAVIEEAKQTLQFIAMRTTKGDDPLDFPADDDPRDDPWEIFFDAREPGPSFEWSKNDDGSDIENEDEYVYFENDIVTWQGATYLCLEQHPFFTIQVATETNPGQEPDDRENPVVTARWTEISPAPPKPRGKWRTDPPGKGRKYHPGDVVWFDKSNSPDKKDSQLQFICIRAHRPNANNRPTAGKFSTDLELAPGNEDLPWRVYLDLNDAIPDPEGGSGGGQEIGRMVDRGPTRPKRIPKQVNAVFILNGTATKMSYDASKADRMEVELTFMPDNNGQDYNLSFNSAKIEWWLYAFDTRRQDYNNHVGSAVASRRLTNLDTSLGDAYEDGVLTSVIRLSTEPGDPNHGFGYSNGTVRLSTILALGIKRKASGDISPSATGRLESATVTIYPLDSEIEES